MSDLRRFQPIDPRSWLRPWHVTLAALTLYIASVLNSAGWDPMALVRVGTHFDPGLAAGSMGYDGQFAYQIALSPLESMSKLDVAAYRLQRILYPLVTRLAVLGHRQLIPWSLLSVNFLATVAGVAITERVMRLFGRSRWWALAYGMNVGMFMSVRLDLTEPLAYCLVQAGVLAWCLRRPQLSAAAFAAAALAKEVTIVLLLGYLAVRLLRGGLRQGLLWGTIALGPFVLWQAALWAWLGRPGISSGGAFATPFELLPLRGWWGLALYDSRSFLTVSMLIVPMVILPAVAGFAGAVKSFSSGANASAAALLLQSAAFLFLPMSNLVDPLGSARSLIGLITAMLNFGAELGWKRVLSYSQLWLLTLAFLPGDRFLPSG